MWRKKCDACGKEINQGIGHVEIRLDFLYDNIKVVDDCDDDTLVTWKHRLDICSTCYPKFMYRVVRLLKIVPDKWTKYCKDHKYNQEKEE